MKIDGVPEDFPLEPVLGSVAGVAPKLLAREIEGRYVVGRPADEHRERYLACEDLANQLAGYCARKARENPEWSREYNLERTGKGLRQKAEAGVWDVGEAERVWVMERVAVLWAEDGIGEGGAG